MPAFSPTIGKFGDVTARGKPWTLWYKQHRKKANIIIGSTLACVLAVGGWWFWQTRYIPAPGGVLVEGMVGQPVNLNPLYSSQNEIDAELTPQIFRSLLIYNQDQELVPDLAESVEVSEDKKTYTITLGRHHWHDGQPVTAKDIAFTIKATQDPEYHGTWSGSFTNVKIEIQDPHSLSLTLNEPYAPFEQNLTIGILPQHILAGKSAKALATDPFNQAPVGTGKLVYENKVMGSNQQIEQLEFNVNGGYIESIKFNFYDTVQEAMTDFKLGKIHSLGGLYTPDFKTLDDFDKHEQVAILQGQSYGLFFNTDQSVKDVEVRQALAYQLPKQSIIDRVLDGHGKVIDTIYHKNHWAYSDVAETYKHDRKEAKKIWDKVENKPDTITIMVPDQPIHQALADQIAVAWSELGVKTNVSAVDSQEISKIFNNELDFSVVLLGEKNRPDPDRYNNWHSTQAPPTGLNITNLTNDRVDKALEDARSINDRDERKVKYATFQDYLSRDVPVIWLYQPEYVYFVNNKVYGVEISTMWSEKDRFATLESWYINQARRQQL